MRFDPNARGVFGKLKMAYTDEGSFTPDRSSKDKINEMKTRTQSEARDLFTAIDSWREESQVQLSKIINHRSSNIFKGIKELIEEVSNMQSKFSVVTKEQNDLLETVDNLKREIMQLSGKLADTEEFYTKEQVD